MPTPPPPPPIPPPSADNTPTSRSSVLSDVTGDSFEYDSSSQTYYDAESVNQGREKGSSVSALEYSDTTMDEYSPGPTMPLPNPPSSPQRQRSDSWNSSSFRVREDSTSKSMRVVRFSPESNRSDDDDDDKDEENQLRSKAHKQQRQTQQHHHAGRHQARRHHSRHQQPDQKQYQPPSDSLATSAGHWMKQLAYSFRSPSPTVGPHQNKHQRKRRPKESSLKEYPHVVASTTMTTDKIHDTDEKSPLLAKNSTTTAAGKGTLASAAQKGAARAAAPVEGDYISIAASFLRDYEANRPPTFAYRRLGDITDRQVALYNIRYGSIVYPVMLTCATLAFFVSSFMEGFFYQTYHRILLTVLNLFGLVVYSVDLWILLELHRPSAMNSTSSHHHQHHRRRLLQQHQQQQPKLPRNGLDHAVRLSRSTKLVQPMILFMIILVVENVARLLVTPDNSLILFSSPFKPLVLFYVSSRARDALEALCRIMRIALRVLLMELLLILMFAAVACRLFHNFEKFRDLSTAWLSLFELSTTVVNPSIWMPMYEASKLSAFFFVFFIITSVFYLHSLVLSVVFQTYIHAATEIHQRSATDREDCIELAYMALKCQQSKEATQPSSMRRDVIDVDLVRAALGIIRPHYNAPKINALVEIVAPSNQATVDYPIFRTKIRQALNASIRTARSASPMAMTAELVAVVVAVVNFAYVILVSSSFDHDWFNSFQEYIGGIITFVAGFELLIRFNPLRIPDFTPLTRLNATFDGLAVFAASVSCLGIVMFLSGMDDGLEFILTGRAVDMIRIMRFFQIFRDVVRRSSDIFPALVGPVILVVTTLHVFVYTGMALWGGAITVGSYGDKITPLYDLNNFNSYQEGAVTVFQLLVVNDWHALSGVFLYASRCSSPSIVYPFFVAGNVFGVSIMLNVMTAFFVQTFVTKLHDDTDAPAEATTVVHKEKGYSIQTSENSPLKRIASGGYKQPNSSVNESEHDADSEGSTESETFEFDVYEREGFDKIMQTVAGNGSGGDGDFARHICRYLEIFESLSPGRESVGWLVCDQQTLERFGNKRFQTQAAGFLEDNELHVVVSDMHSELLALSTRASFQGRSLIRRIRHKRGGSSRLEVSASLLRRQPALSLFVSRVVEANKAES